MERTSRLGGSGAGGVTWPLLLIDAAGEEAAVDDQSLAVDEAGGFRSKKYRGAGQLFGQAEAAPAGWEDLNSWPRSVPSSSS